MEATLSGVNNSPSVLSQATLITYSGLPQPDCRLVKWAHNGHELTRALLNRTVDPTLQWTASLGWPIALGRVQSSHGSQTSQHGRGRHSRWTKHHDTRTCAHLHLVQSSKSFGWHPRRDHRGSARTGATAPPLSRDRREWRPTTRQIDL